MMMSRTWLAAQFERKGRGLSPSFNSFIAIPFNFTPIFGKSANHIDASPGGRALQRFLREITRWEKSIQSLRGTTFMRALFNLFGWSSGESVQAARQAHEVAYTHMPSAFAVGERPKRH